MGNELHTNACSGAHHLCDRRDLPRDNGTPLSVPERLYSRNWIYALYPNIARGKETMDQETHSIKHYSEEESLGVYPTISPVISRLIVSRNRFAET